MFHIQYFLRLQHIKWTSHVTSNIGLRAVKNRWILSRPNYTATWMISHLHHLDYLHIKRQNQPMKSDLLFFKAMVFFPLHKPKKITGDKSNLDTFAVSHNRTARVKRYSIAAEAMVCFIFHKLHDWEINIMAINWSKQCINHLTTTQFSIFSQCRLLKKILKLTINKYNWLQ